jgi:hypothetical protein
MWKQFRLGLVTTGFIISPVTSDVWMLIRSIKHRLMTKKFHNL